jgi:hypothetical protein
VITCSLQPGLAQEAAINCVSGKRNNMTLKSVREDLQSRTLSAISGLLGKLAYFASLRRDDGSYAHWGLSRVHGNESAQRALGEAHKAVFSSVLRTPLGRLTEDVRESCKSQQVPEDKFLSGLQREEELLVPQKPGPGSRRHLSSVLQALSALLRTPR